MKSLLSLVALVLLFTSCTTAYKSGQTPDDVYFSPQRMQQQDEYVQTDNRNSRYRQNNNDDEYGYNDDQYLRMRVHNRGRWSTLDDELSYGLGGSYGYSPYSSAVVPYVPYSYNYFNNLYYNNLWSPFSYGYNYYSPYSYYSPYGYYNPYGSHVMVVNPKSPLYNRPRTSNLRVYDGYGTPSNSRTSTNNRRLFGRSENNTYVTPNSNNNQKDRGSALRNIFGDNNTNSRPVYNNNTQPRTFDVPSSSNSSGSGSRGSSNAPARRF